MQILPTRNKTVGLNPLDYFGSANFASKSGIDFAGLLNPGVSASASASMQEHFAPGRPLDDMPAPAPEAVHEPAAMRPNEAMRDAKMSREDYSAVRDELAKSGVSQERLEELDRKAQSPEGLTWGQMMHAVRQDVTERFMKPAQLTEADKAEVSSLLVKMGFSHEEAGRLLQAMRSGKPGKALEAISQKLAAMDQGATLTLNRDEMAALAKALNLPEGAAAKLMAGFGGKDSLELTAKGMLQALGAVKDELAGALAQVRDAMGQVKHSLEPLMDKAARRLGIEQEARDATVRTEAKFSTFLKEPAEAAQGEKPAAQAKPVGNGQSGQHQAGDPAQARDGRGKDQQAAGRNAAQDAGAQSARGWADFTAKVKAEGLSPTAGDGRFASVQDAAARLAGQGASQGEGGQAAARVRDAQVLSQVESGILRNLGQGVKQLSLELTPETLGRLNVVLTVKGKEVQAVIRAESPQAEKAIAENLQQIKQNLEDQGLTVSKLEVRAGLSQDSAMGQQWGGAEKHNLSQERREALDRMRANSLLADASQAGGLARAMQNEGVAARNAQGGLNIIA